MGLVQFINILDFMMVMPLGPDFAAALGIPASHIGYVGGSYTVAAAVSGLIASFFLDRFDRRAALAVSLAGLAVATAAGGLAVDLPTLLLARIAAGALGGPAYALSMSVIADNVAVERRGRAMGLVMGAFAASSVLGVPIGLELARLGGWRMPFFAVAALGALVMLAVFQVLTPQRAHLGGNAVSSLERLVSLFGRRRMWLAYALAVLMMMQGFMIIPNIAAYAQFNLDFPRAQMGLLYLLGGSISFFGTRAAGSLVDRFGSAPVTLVTTVLFCAVIWSIFVDYWTGLPLLALFPLFMFFSSARMVANSAIISKVPEPRERAGFSSMVGAVHHLASAMGAFLSAMILDTAADGSLLHMPANGITAIALGVPIPLLMVWLERDVRRRAAPVRVPEEAVT